MGATWTFREVSAAIIQGTTAATRTGNSVFLKSVDIYLRVYGNINMNNQGCLCRFVFIHDKEAKGAAFAITDIFTLDRVDAMQNQVQKSRFTLLRDQTCAMVVTAANAAANQSVGPITLIRWRIPLNKKVTYQDNTGAVTGVQKDNYVFGHTCSHATSGAVEFTYRLNFLDG